MFVGMVLEVIWYLLSEDFLLEGVGGRGPFVFKEDFVLGLWFFVSGSMDFVLFVVFIICGLLMGGGVFLGWYVFFFGLFSRLRSMYVVLLE